MFGIGFSEIIIVFLAILIFVRPNDLPKFLRTAGRLYGKAKKAYNELIAVKDRIVREIDEAAAPIKPSALPPAMPSAMPPVPAEGQSAGKTPEAL
jgi:Sec-independent protein translocase protein TatA